MKIIKRILIIFIVLLFIASIGLYFYLQSFKPQYEGEFTLKKLKKDVEVYFDNYAIPHIYAKNEEDAYYALGYVHAQERLFQMEIFKRAGSGRLAEIFGEDLAETDRFFRTIGLRESAKESAKKYMSERKEPYQKAAWAYLDGVNAYIKNGQTPLEYALLGLKKEEYTVEDMYCIMAYMGFSFAHALKTEPILTKIHHKLGEKYTKDFAIDWKEGTKKIPVYPELKEAKNDSLPSPELISQSVHKIFDKLPTPVWMGSNAWVVSGEKSKSGKVIFSNDTHIGYAQPSIWYEAHLEYPNFSFYGNYIAGVPFANLGHTRQHAWGLTMLENDDIDLYQEKTNPDNRNQAKFRNNWEDMTIRKESIKIKGKEKPLEFDVKITRHGPIINDCFEAIRNTTDRPISMFMTYTQFPSQLLQASYDFAKAKNIKEFEKACSIVHAPGFNVMYGDAKGNIAWWATAKLTKRPKHVNSKFILNGYDGKDEILGYYDFSENPKAINPPSNFVYSANNQPDTAYGVLHQGYYVPEFRAKRIVSYLEKDEKWDIDKMKGMITDAVSAKYPEIAKEIVEEIERKSLKLSKNQAEALKLLKNWKGKHDLESLEPTIYYKLIYHVLAETIQDEIGKDDFKSLLNIFMMRRTIPFLVKNNKSLWWDNIKTKTKETRQDIFVKAFKKTISQLEKQLGNNPKKWEWQKVHSITHQHTLGRQGGWLGWFFNVGAIPVNGGHEVINNLTFNLNEEGLYPVTSGPAIRILIDFDDVENSVSVLPSGQSGRIMSKHYDDQAQMFAKGKFRKQMMNKEEIKKNSRKLVLKAD